MNPNGVRNFRCAGLANVIPSTAISAVRFVVALTFCFAFMFDLSGTLVLPALAGGNSAVRVLQFPAKQSIGVLRINRSKGNTIQAKGRIEVPANANIELRLAYEAAHDLSPLKDLPPDGIQRLVLASLEVEDDQLKYIENLTGLEDIDVEETEIGDAGLRWLHKLTKLKNLRLKSTLVTGKGLVYLKPLVSLRNLSLSSNSIGDAGLENIVGLKNLKVLSLTRCQITDRGLQQIASLTQLEKLELEFNKITDSGIASLVGLKNLRELFLSDNLMTGNCIKYLKQLSNLEKLIYSSKNFKPNDVARLKAALPHCHVEEYLKDRNVQLDLFEPLH
ncbi:MAG: hypothetical protein EKK48_04405 [Candidatus Melainabacteria bacterium]|nr:MAG: hypothetical protein EKK48_04405 [Candidatus Melainabacteria bacterium]